MNLPEPLTLRSAAGLLGCESAGDPELILTGLNEIHRVRPGDLTFVDTPKYYAKALASDASAVLINQQLDPPPGKGLIFTSTPFDSFNRLLEWAQPALPLDQAGQPRCGPGVRMGLHTVAGEDVEIGEGTEIGHHVVIGSHVRIGKHCRIHPRVTIGSCCEIGDYVCINPGTVIGSEAFYFRRSPERYDKLLSKGRVRIGSHVDIGANCTIDRGVTADTVIGDWTKLDNLVQVGHDTVIGRRCIIAAQAGIAGVVQIEDEVVIWGQAGISKDLTIGKGAVIQGKTGVMSSLEGGKTYLGMIATESRRYLRELAALRRLPELLRRLDREP
ncbi:MAG: UDP-3-O-(3-hydroxymyristoyl)glucosamine N-acyltransferase [Bacteroidia bacterium]|nr:UDP-3-O-(3-hydroxymyristoyl)glucosamine N-acyltransferase [Bacteroidia bacterium]